MSLTSFRRLPRLPQGIQITIVCHATHMDHSRLCPWLRPGRPDQSYYYFLMRGFVLILPYLNEKYSTANLRPLQVEHGDGMERRRCMDIKIESHEDECDGEKVALNAWRDDKLDITPIERHFQYHMNIVLDDDDEELDCIRERVRMVDLVDAVLGFHRENGICG